MKRAPLQRKTELRRTSGLSSHGSLERKSPPKRPPKPISQASKAQREKVERMGFCLACRVEGVHLDPAHVIDRSLGGCDHPDCIVPLCRSCHDDYDHNRLELLPILQDRDGFLKEQAHAVLHLGIAGAFERTTGYRWKAPLSLPASRRGGS